MNIQLYQGQLNFISIMSIGNLPATMFYAKIRTNWPEYSESALIAVLFCRVMDS